MKAVVTRVNSASVSIDGAVHGKIGKGFLILLGVGPDDTPALCRKLAEKVLGLRVFRDENDKMNRSLADVGGSVLVVSQFTLFGDVSHGRRPSFTGAAKPDLAIPLYEQFELLKQNVAAIFAGLISGVLTSVICVLVLSLLFHFDHAQYVTLLPKSITTAIGMGISEELGGYVTITVAVIIITGIIGNVLAETICRVFKIEEPVAKGIAIGSSAHALGTAKALELGEIEGAMSSLSIAVAGILTVIAAPIFATLL